MSLWNFLCGFAVFNAVCDLFSSKPKQTYTPPQPYRRDYEPEDYISSCGSDDIDFTDVDELQDRVDELEMQLGEMDPLSDAWDELQDRIDELQDRIDSLEEWEDLQDELDDLRDELDELEYERDFDEW